MGESQRPRLVIVKTGDKLPELAAVAGDFEDWIRKGLQLQDIATQVVAVHRQETLPPAATVAGAVISGSAAMVTDHSDWIERTAEWLRELVAAQTPVLGICFGHQLLAYALGGDVQDNSNGIEVGTVRVQLQSAAQHDTLFSKLPRTLGLHASHRQSVRVLPPQATLLASSEMDPHHAFRVGMYAWGVQFHPEFTGAITAEYAAYYRRQLAANNRSGTFASIQQSYDTPFGDVVLRGFAQVVEKRCRDHRPLEACSSPGPAGF